MIAPLTDEQLEQLADLIADRLAERQAGELIDAAELAKRIGRSREFVYANQAALGAVRLGDGERPRLAFRWPHALDGLEAAERQRKATTPGRTTSRARKQRDTAGVELLPIRGGSR
jgi:hypothetical protein